MSKEPKLSILVPTLESRRELCATLRAQLDAQIEAAGGVSVVELLFLLDDGKATIGAKRNELLDMARGRFVVFVDDDDGVSGDYVERILAAIASLPEPDCVGFRGEITFRGAHPREFVHSLNYPAWQHERGRYVRPPGHLTPIRRTIAARYRFESIDYSEDVDWAARLVEDDALKSEVFIDAVLYRYDSRRWFAYQWLLDRTQPLRHTLGLTFANRVRRRREGT